MVGEIRDVEIVKIVVRVVIIGYLVISILYINDVVFFIVRLLEM